MRGVGFSCCWNGIGHEGVRWNIGAEVRPRTRGWLGMSIVLPFCLTLYLILVLSFPSKNFSGLTIGRPGAWFFWYFLFFCQKHEENGLQLDFFRNLSVYLLTTPRSQCLQIATVHAPFFFAPETITTSCRNHVLHPSSRQIVEVPRVTWPCSPKLNKAQCPPLTEDPTTAWPKAACRLTQKIGITHTHTLPKRPHVTTVGNPSDFETTFFCTFRSLDLFPFKTCGSSEHLRCCPKTRCCGCYRLSQHVPSHNLSRVKKNWDRYRSTSDR